MDTNEIKVGRWLEMHAKNPFAAGLRERFTLPNPEYETALRLGYSVAGIPREVLSYERVGNVYRFPRAAVHGLVGEPSFRLVDETEAGEDWEIPSLITPRDYQLPFIERLHKTLSRPDCYGATGKAAAGYGKTACGLEIISRVGKKTLVVVHKEFLMTQWAIRILGTEEAARLLGVSPKQISQKIEPKMLDLRPEEVGLVQQDRCEWRGRAIVIAMAQSLIAREYEPEFYKSFGLVLVDECVHADSEVLTDSGYKRAEDLYRAWQAGDAVTLLVPTPEGMAPFPLTHAWERTKESSLVVETGTGERIRVSREHEFRVLSRSMDLEWKQAQDLEEGDCIVSPRDPNYLSEGWSREGYFLGLFVGDGTYPSRNQVRFAVTKDVPEWRSALSACGVDFRESVNGRGDTVFVVSGEAVEWVRRLGFSVGRKSGKMGRVGITENGEAWTRSFLRGLFDTEGNVLSDRIQISMTDEHLMREVHRTLRLAGIEGRLVLRPRDNPRHGDMTQVSLFGPAARLFMSKVGFGFERKSAQALSMVPGKAADGVSVGPWIDSVAETGLSYAALSRITGFHRSKLEPSGPQRLSLPCVRRFFERLRSYLDGVDTSSWESVSEHKLVTCRDVAESVGASVPTVWRNPERFRDTYQRIAEQKIVGLLRLIDKAEWTRTSWVEPVRSVTGDVGGRFYDFEVPLEHRFVSNGLEVHNCHRFSAPEFKKAIVQFPARLRLGVTATPKRKDGMQDVFFGHIGDIAVVGEEKHKRKPRVNQVRTPVVVTPDQMSRLKVRGRLNYTKTVTYLTEHEARNRQIVSLLFKAAQKGRKILVLSDRTKHLETLREMYLGVCQKNEFACVTDYYVGGMKLQERLRAEKAQVLFATYAMAAEGLDIPTLDTLFLVTPRGPDMIEQYVGRILRLSDEKLEPVLVDFVDERIATTNRMGFERKREYARKGWL